MVCEWGDWSELVNHQVLHSCSCALPENSLQGALLSTYGEEKKNPNKLGRYFESPESIWKQNLCLAFTLGNRKPEP